MAAHHRLPAITAAALTTAMLLARWRATRAAHDAHGASAAKAPWRRTAPPPAAAGTADDRVAAPHTSFMGPALRETDAHLEQYWNKLKFLYPQRDDERRHG
ncbi:hypothetical protein OHA91_03340 [Streptomyces erythrochromogenes]|uniref:Uncharacterized protein n=1 Tax=Streptomyces erythrochromogenes TaxID=285574 RepID=A0ABZ1Q567_9ACTN|nr:hypothetical protein [Streptomyces erythrochromogenes]